MHIRVGICPYMVDQGRSGLRGVQGKSVGGCGIGPYMEAGAAPAAPYGVLEEWLQNSPPWCLGGRERNENKCGQRFLIRTALRTFFRWVFSKRDEF